MPYTKGTVFHHLTLLDFCGGGAYGEVYLVRDLSERLLAVKIISKTKLGDGWRRELRGLVNYQRLLSDCPHLLKIHHVDEDENHFYYTMDAADDIGADGIYCADTLQNRLAHGPVAVKQLLEIARQLLMGLKEIHEAGMRHRDLKPSNILFVKGKPQIGDIGLMSSAQSMMTKLAGTLEFIPPEIRRKPEAYQSDKSPAPDIYAFGMLLYCAMTSNSPDKFPSLPIELEESRDIHALNRVICRACAQDPLLRIRDCDEFLEQLETVACKLKHPGVLDGRWRDNWEDWQRYWNAVGLHCVGFIGQHRLVCGVLGLSLIAAGIYCWDQYRFGEINRQLREIRKETVEEEQESQPAEMPPKKGQPPQEDWKRYQFLLSRTALWDDKNRDKLAEIIDGNNVMGIPNPLQPDFKPFCRLKVPARWKVSDRNEIEVLRISEQEGYHLFMPGQMGKIDSGRVACTSYVFYPQCSFDWDSDQEWKNRIWNNWKSILPQYRSGNERGGEAVLLSRMEIRDYPVVVGEFINPAEHNRRYWHIFIQLPDVGIFELFGFGWDFQVWWEKKECLSVLESIELLSK